MEAASRLALLAVVARAGSPLPKDEKAKHLPRITVEEYDVEAADGDDDDDDDDEGLWLLYQPKKRALRRGNGGDAAAAAAPAAAPAPAARHRKGTRGAGGLESAAWWILLVLESLLVAAVEGWIIYMVYDGGDYAVWNWLSDFASPALMILFSVSFSAALLRCVGCSGRVGDLAFQAAGLVLATFCAVVVCAGVGEGKRRRSEGEDEDEAKGVRVLVGLAVKMWFLFFIGFWCAVFQWYSGDRRDKQQRRRTMQRKGKKRERGYGATLTTTGRLATVDEACEGVVGDL